MSTNDHWIKPSQWYQEYFESHVVSLSSSKNNSQSKTFRNRRSYTGINQRKFYHNGVRRVRDSICGNISRAIRMTSTITAKKRDHFEKLTTCDPPSNVISSDENILISWKVKSMSKKRTNKSRRFSLAKFESTSVDSTRTKDTQKSTITSTGLNLIQKLLFRQINPKTRPLSTRIQSDDNRSTTKISNETPTSHEKPSPTSSTQSFTTSLSFNSPGKNANQTEEQSLTSSPNKFLSASPQSDLNSYLAKRRNTTGSISFHKIVDNKNNLSPTTLKLTMAVNAFHLSNSKLSSERDIFQTIEDSDLLATKQLIQTNESIINSYNEYDWRPLDVAIMLNNILIIQFLLQHGAEESPKIQSEESRYQSLCRQLSICNEQNSDETTKKSSSNKLVPDDNLFRRSSPVCEKQQRIRRSSKSQQQLYGQHLSALTQMKQNYEQADVPDTPTNVHLLVSGSDNITVTFDEPYRSNGTMVIKYKIEWSVDEYFNDVSFDIIKNCLTKEYVIRNLTVGQKCYVRISAGNMKGFGNTIIANPPYCIPSSWRDFSKTSRTSICDLRFEEILNKIFNERDGNGINRPLDGNESSDASSRRNYRRGYGNIRKNLRQLFQVYPRLAKSIKRGLYLVSVIINNERILVTNEDVLPMVEVDENYGHNLLTDFQWFMKLTFVWDDLKSLRPNLERCSSATTFYLRTKLVQAAIELQTLEETNNLGRLHHTYIRDNDGNVAFVLINDISADMRSNISTSNLKWMTMTKFFEIMKESSSLTNNSCFQQIIEKLSDMINSYHASMRRLDPGLYVAYLKMQNSVDSVRVMVNKYMTGSLPCVKIRSVANVSKEEWQWVHNSNNETSNEDKSCNYSLELFKSQFLNSAKELFIMLDLPETHFSNSRIYDSQVVEIRDDLSLIILMSTADEVNILSSPTNHSLTSFIYLPVYIFEVFQHLSNNYRFIQQYCRVSICLDFELINAQQNQREAFSINELDETRCRLKHLLSCQQDLDDIWRLSRWLVHVINCAKDKTYSGISLKPFQYSTNLNEIKTEESSSLTYILNSNDYLLEQTFNNIIDIDDNNDAIELTIYKELLNSSTYIPLKLKLHKMTKLSEILHMISKTQQNTLLESDSPLNIVWTQSNECEDIMDENLTAFEIQTRLLEFGGQIHVRSSSSLSESSRTFNKNGNIVPSRVEINVEQSGSTLSLNV